MTIVPHFTKIESLIDAAYEAHPGAKLEVEIPGFAWDQCIQQLKDDGHEPVGILSVRRQNFRFRGEAIVRGAKWLVHVVEGK